MTISSVVHFFFFNDTATTEIYTLSLHDALPIFLEPLRQEVRVPVGREGHDGVEEHLEGAGGRMRRCLAGGLRPHEPEDRKSTRLNSSHANISYAVFCLKKKKNTHSGIYQYTCCI